MPRTTEPLLQHLCISSVPLGGYNLSRVPQHDQGGRQLLTHLYRWRPSYHFRWGLVHLQVSQRPPAFNTPLHVEPQLPPPLGVSCPNIGQPEGPPASQTPPQVVPHPPPHPCRACLACILGSHGCHHFLLRSLRGLPSIHCHQRCFGRPLGGHMDHQLPAHLHKVAPQLPPPPEALCPPIGWS